MGGKEGLTADVPPFSGAISSVFGPLRFAFIFSCLQPAKSASFLVRSLNRGPLVKMTSKVTHVLPRRFADERGWFTEVYNKEKFRSFGIDDDFVQDNHSLSKPIHTLRGLHFQTPPHAQAKLVRCLRGRIFDVAVDIRKGSPTFGQWKGVELSAENGEQLYIPAGFAHGFLTLEPDSEVAYKVSDRYSPQNDGGLLWNAPDIGVDWPLPAGAAPVLSPKDERHPTLSDFDSPFAYDGQPLELVKATS